ncbi:MAG TPA: chemotaxis protein CheB [Chloroflexota bacterium]|nr:chemotaxis protein CheB [Chloroflexota bacterium]
MPNHDIVVIGASAGGVTALRELVGGFRVAFPASAFVVLHLPPYATSALPQILDRGGPVKAVAAVDDAPVQPGRIYVAPPDCHLTIEDGRVRVSRGPKWNRYRPAIDVLFRSAAVAYGPRVVGIVLSGSLDDGSLGLASIKAHGGTTIVQDPAEALFPGMPGNALDRVEIDYCLPLGEIPAVLTELVDGRSSQPEKGRLKEVARMEESAATGEDIESVPGLIDEQQDGPPSVYTCPECHGSLWQVETGNLKHYQCRVGHSYSPESLFGAQGEALEAGLWAALRALEERIDLATRLEREALHAGRSHSATHYRERIGAASKSAEVVRTALQLSLKGQEVDIESESTA